MADAAQRAAAVGQQVASGGTPIGYSPRGAYNGASSTSRTASAHSSAPRHVSVPPHSSPARVDTNNGPSDASAAVMAAASPVVPLTVHERLMDTAAKMRDVERARRMALESRVAANSDELRHRQSEFEAVRHSASAFASERDELAFQYRRLRGDADAREGELAHVRSENELLRSQLVGASSELLRAEELSKQRATDLAAMALAKSKLERQLLKLQSEVSGTIASSNSVMDDAERRAGDAVRKQRELRDALQSTEDELAHVASRLQTKTHEFEVTQQSLHAVTGENDQLRAELQLITARAEELESRLQQTIEERTTKTQQILADTDAQITSLSTALSERTTMHSTTLAEKNELIDTLSAQVTDLRGQVAVVAPTLLEKDEIISELRRDANQWEANVADRSQQLDAAKLELQECRTKLATTEADRRALEGTVARQQRLAAEREAQLKECQLEVTKLRAEIADSVDKLHTAIAHADSAAREGDARKAEIAAHKDEVELLRIRNQELSTAARDDRAAREQLALTLERVTSQLERTKWDAQCASEAAQARERALKEDREYLCVSHAAEVEQATIRAQNREKLTEERHAALVGALEQKLAAADTRIAALQRAVDDAHAGALRDVQREQAVTEAAIEKRLAAVEQQRRAEVEDAVRQGSARVEEAKAEAIRRLEAARASHAAERNTVELERLRERDLHAREVEEARERAARAEQLMDDLRGKLHSSEKALQAALEMHRAELSRVNDETRRREMELHAAVARAEQQASERAYRDRESLRAKDSETHEQFREEEGRLRDRLYAEKEVVQRLTAKVASLESAVARELRLRSLSLQDCESLGRRLVAALAQADFFALLSDFHLDKGVVATEALKLSLEWSEQTLLAEEQRSRHLTEVVASVGGDAINIMMAYKCVREDLRQFEVASPQRERVVHHLQDRNAQLLERIEELEKSVHTESERRSRVEKHYAEELQRAQRDLEIVADEDRRELARQLQRATAASAPLLHHRREELTRELWNHYSLAVVMRRHAQATFQLPSWQYAVARGTISDDLGAALCRILEDVHATADSAYRSICFHLTDDEKRALGASPEEFPSFADHRRGAAFVDPAAVAAPEGRPFADRPRRGDHAGSPVLLRSEPAGLATVAVTSPSRQLPRGRPVQTPESPLQPRSPGGPASLLVLRR